MLPTIIWQRKDPQDVLQGIKTVEQCQSKSIGRILVEGGRGVAKSLEWAAIELNAAREASRLGQVDSEHRHASNAIIYSQSAIECIVDCKLRTLWRTAVPNVGLEAKIKIIEKYSPKSQFPAQLFSRTVKDRRNSIIHQFIDFNVEEATVVFQCCELIVKSFPCSEYTFGYALSQPFADIAAESESFSGFQKSFAFLWYDPAGDPFLASGVKIDDQTAEVWWCPVSCLSERQHVSLMSMLLGLEINTNYGDELIQRQLALANLLTPGE